MKKEFESEIRISIQDITKFTDILNNLKGKIVQKYKFTDHIYIPQNPSSDWNPRYKTMRIRQQFSPEQYSRILFTQNELVHGKLFQFKRSLYPQGKIELFKGDQKTAEAILRAWDYVPYFRIEKTDGNLYEIPQPLKFIIAVEEIAQFGYSAEIELWGEDILKIEDKFLTILSVLKISPDAANSNPLPYIIAKHLRLPLTE
jgi:adenylate cyclase class IV